MSATTQSLEYKVGELAKRTGLTVRTLHHYDTIGLLRPGARSPAGHRMYGPDDIARLQKISSLRQLGLSLAEIGGVLDSDASSMAEVLARQVEFLRDRITSEERLVQKLEAILKHINASEDPSAEHLLETIALTATFEKYYSTEQLSQLEHRAAEVGDKRMQETQDEWSALHRAMDDARTRGKEPHSDEVRTLARKAKELIGEFTGGDAGIAKSLGTMVRTEGAAMYKLWGISEELAAFYQEAMAALEVS